MSILPSRFSAYHTRINAGKILAVYAVALRKRRGCANECAFPVLSFAFALILSKPNRWLNKNPQSSVSEGSVSVAKSVKLLVTGEEKASIPKDEREITLDDFTFAMQNETKDLTDMDKQILLSMARQLNDARKKKNGESG